MKNKNGDSIESYLQNSEDLQNLKELVDQARISKNAAKTGENHYIHKAVETGSMQWLQFYAFFGGNFKSFNARGERPLDIAINEDNADLVLYVTSQCQELLDDQSIFCQVFNFLESQILDKKIRKSLLQKYKTLLRKLVKIGVNNNKNVQFLLDIIKPNSLAMSNEESNYDLVLTIQL